jgi:hypothetical protein
MARTLTPEIEARKAAKLCFHQRYELAQGGTVSFSPGNQKRGDLGLLEGRRGRG